MKNKNRDMKNKNLSCFVQYGFDVAVLGLAQDDASLASIMCWLSLDLCCPHH
uniref:Uncharacterized protein n=1 Tax=Setaria italica TaxID=4555 RepID=K3XQA8_SETIT